jgi:two-component system OmpR family response regulator
MKPGEVMHVFLVDDDQMFQKSLGHYINYDKNLPIRFSCFNSGEDCVKNLVLKPDVIILDYVLGDSNETSMNGIEVLENIRKKSPETAVIMLSGKANVEIVAGAMKRGAVDFIEKNEMAFLKVQHLINDAIQAILHFGLAGNLYSWMRKGSGQHHTQPYPKSHTFFSPITLSPSINKKFTRPKQKKRKTPANNGSRT